MKRAHQHEITWMASALIHARDNASRYAALVEQLKFWPEAKLIPLAAKLSPAPGVSRTRITALEAIESFARSRPPRVVEQMRRAIAEIAWVSNLFEREK